MQLIDQHSKKIMEECKIRARDEGLSFDDETLEYIVTNRDMLELSPKGMIPTLYDYWVNDVQIIQKKEIYKLYPHNPYETVINTRPAVSFYNDNNPDWLNIMIFYHVLGHIDFFQNNIFFKHTWDYDFAGKALADKRLINSLRSEHGRFVDYVIEFARSIDNLNGYHRISAKNREYGNTELSPQLEFYFQVFLQDIKNKDINYIADEIKKYNIVIEQTPDLGESLFLAEIKHKFPDFEARYKSYNEKIQKQKKYIDVIEFIIDKSEFLNKDENEWMKQVINIVRETAIYFEPQIRTKTINEGWASYWHEYLFMRDKRIKGHESDFARINAGVTSISRVGLNPYAIGLRLFQFIEDSANKGKMQYLYQKINDIEQRKNFNKKTKKGKEAIFEVRKNFNDFTFVNTFVNQEFVDEYNLFTVGKRLNEQEQVIEYYIKSRKAEDYKQMLINNLYHPPKITVDTKKTNEKNLYLVHTFEGKQLVKDYIADVMVGLEYLWGNQVQLETTEIFLKQKAGQEAQISNRKVLYTCKNKNVIKTEIKNGQ